MPRDSARQEGFTYITPYGYQAGSCGYCKDPNSSQRTPNSRGSYYANTKQMTVDHYKDLMDRGWRRSGTLIYKPDPKRSCCPHYTIRIPVRDFKPSRDQRQALHRWNRFVLGEKYMNEVAKLYPKSKEQKKKEKTFFDLLHSVHESEYSNLKRPPEPAHKFEVTLEEDTYSDEKYDLYENYQRAVHHEKPGEFSKSSFKRFLCGSPLERRISITGKLGTYHQCYRLDGRLVALAVLDILPCTVSAVYFLYHSDVESHSFGKLSALREAALAAEYSLDCHYYMGYYIHSCAKMRYKADYRPQFVLDLETLTWDPLEGELRRELDHRKYVSMSQVRKAREQAASNGGEVTDGMEGVEATGEEVLQSPSQMAGCSLFEINVPGVLTPFELTERVDLDQTLVALRDRRSGGGADHVFVPAEALHTWEEGSFTDPQTLKGVVAELAATVGEKVAAEMVVDFM